MHTYQGQSSESSGIPCETLWKQKLNAEETGEKELMLLSFGVGEDT